MPEKVYKASLEKLLTTPWTSVFIARRGDKVVGYSIVGKGFDLMGVAHEWGLKEGFEPCELFMGLFELLDFNEIIALSPSDLGDMFIEKTKGRVESHPLALFKLYNTDLDPSQIYLWGLDSI